MHACIWINYSIISDETFYDIIDVIPIFEKINAHKMHNTTVEKALLIINKIKARSKKKELYHWLCNLYKSFLELMYNLLIMAKYKYWILLNYLTVIMLNFNC